MASQWKDFKAFAGTLTTAMLDHHPLGIHYDIDTFYSWLVDVLQNPESHGIPKQFRPDVAIIRDALFKDGTVVKPMRTFFEDFIPASEIEDANSKGEIKNDPEAGIKENNSETRMPQWKPITVRFGPQLKAIQIIDAPTALGYLFSIVEPPKDITLNWEKYWLPMLVLFSRCLYLAFVDITADKKAVLVSVPVMANVMYQGENLDLESPVPVMFGAGLPFGAALPFGPPAKDQDNVGEKQKARAKLWRRKHILVADLNQGPGKLLPLDEAVLSILVLYLNKYMLGFKNPTNAIEAPLSQLLNQTLEANRIKLSKRYQKKIKIVELGKLVTNPKTEDDTVRLLESLIRRRYALDGPEKTDSLLNQAFRDLIRYYLTPHAFLSGQSQEVPISDDDQTSIDNLVNDLWSKNEVRNSAFAKLQRMIYKHQQEDDPTIAMWGKCAETYPVVGVGPTYFDNMTNNMASVHGLAIEPRGIGLTKLFQTEGFSLETLRQVHGPCSVDDFGLEKQGHKTKHVSRFPCPYCRKLLPAFGVLAGPPPPAPEYDNDLNAAQMESW